MTLSNDSPLSGEIISIVAEIQNLGGLEAKDVRVRFYDGEPSYGIQLGDDQIISKLSPSGITTLTTQWLATAGIHDIYVVVDPLNSISESNEDNNRIFRTVTVPGNKLPELGLTKNDITFSKSDPVKGENITVNATIHNTGMDASNILILTYLGNPMSGGIQIGATTIPNLSSNSTTNIQTQWLINKPAGNYDIYIWIDPYNTIPEGNEHDNIAFNTITVREKKVSVDVTTDKPQYEANSDVGIKVTVKNYDRISWSGTGEIYIEDISGNLVKHVATFIVQDLKPTGLFEWTYRIPVPIIAPRELRDTLAEVDIDFTQIFTSLGIPDKTVDKNSIRVPEFDEKGSPIGEKQVRADFKTDTIAKVIWFVDGLTIKESTRYFYVYFDITDNGSKEPSTNTKLPQTGRLIAFSDDTGKIYLTESKGDGTFGTSVMIDDVSTANDYTRGIILDDFNNDGVVDIVTGSGSNGEVYYYQNKADGSDTFLSKVKIGSITTSSYIMDIAAADFNNDGNKDFVISGNANNLLYLFKGNGDGTFIQSTISAPSGTNYFRGKTSADVDGDGDADLVVGNSYGVIYLYKGNGDGTFLSPLQIVDIGSDPYGLVTGDFDKDGKIDIIANNGNTGDSYLLKGNGNGTFGTPSLIPSLDTNNLTAFDAGDFNNDGHLDVIAVTYSIRTIEFYPGNGDGTFGVKTTIALTTNNILGISSSPALAEVYPEPGIPEAVPSQSFNFIWNTGSTPPGNYKVHVTLSEGQGFIAEDYAPFEILPDIRVDSKVSTDKIAYNANETVTITSNITSLSENTILENLTAKITISYHDQATNIYTETQTIPILTLGQLTELKTYWNTGQNPPGTYNISLKVSFAGHVISTSSASFQILDSYQTGDGLVGTISANPSLVEEGESLTLNYSVTNNGNTDIPLLMVKVLIVDPDTQIIKTEFSAQYALNKGETINEARSLSTLDFIPKTYLAILQAEVNGNTRSLANTTFEVKPKPKPGIEITKTIPDVKNVLVWLNYPWQSGQDIPDRVLIEQALNEAGVNYHIVLDKKDFEAELRNPYYTDFMILGDHHPIEDHFSEELREQVYSGKGLISSMFNRQNLDAEVFGIKFNGYLSGKDYPIELLESEIATQGNLQSYGRALKIDALNTDKIIAWIVETTKKGTNRYPGIIRNEYGNGKVLFYAFDLGMSTPSYSQFATVLKNSLNYIHKPISNPEGLPYIPDQLIPVEIKIKSLGGAFDLRITETYPADLKIYDPSTGKWITDNLWVINIHLEPDETEAILYYALIPDKAGKYTLQRSSVYRRWHI
jgi:hypothetical protein